MIHTTGYAAKSAHSALKPFEFERSEPKAGEVQIEILYCGVCHSDVHQARNEWHNTVYPCMPGHEIVGRVVKTGSGATRFKVGAIVGVGCMVDSCHECVSCREGLEQYCEKGFLATYNGNMRNPTAQNNTFGGYSDFIVVRESFVLSIPDNLSPAAAGPIMCAGVTTYSPLKHWKVGPGMKVGIIGLGGLGHMAIKLAKAMGANVTLITTSQDKEKDAYRIGADNVIYSKSSDEMKDHENSLDFILSTIPQPHDANNYTALLKRDGVLAIVGCIAPLTKPIDLSKMITDRKSIGTSLIGGIAETQEVLDFCSQHGILPDTKLISIDKINDAFDDIDKGLVDFRYVIDMASVKGRHEEKGLLEKLHLASFH